MKLMTELNNFSPKSAEVVQNANFPVMQLPSTKKNPSVKYHINISVTVTT